MDKIKVLYELYDKLCVENKRLTAILAEKDKKISYLEELAKCKITTL
jgi:hypothetical protein